MSNNAFIFPSTPRQRVIGHLSFWAFFTLHFFIQNLIVETSNKTFLSRTPLQALISVSYFLPVYILSAYVYDAFVVKRFLFLHRYIAFAMATIGLLLLDFIACYFAGVLCQHKEWKMPYNQINFATNKYHAIVNGGFVSVMILGITGGLRFARQWWQKQRENETIQQQKIASELQLLKIQINPRFLFHSLSTVKQSLLTGSSNAPQLILQVADLLSYILYESDHDQVPLEKELAMIDRYLSLEENSAEVDKPTQMVVSGSASSKEIVPLILLSVVETAFEYFLLSRNRFSVEIKIEIAGDQLSFHLQARGSFAGLQSAEEKFRGNKKQVSILAGGDQSFRVESDAGYTSIYLQLPLCAKPVIPEKGVASSTVYEAE